MRPARQIPSHPPVPGNYNITHSRQVLGGTSAPGIGAVTRRPWLATLPLAVAGGPAPARRRLGGSGGGSRGAPHPLTTPRAPGRAPPPPGGGGRRSRVGGIWVHSWGASLRTHDPGDLGRLPPRVAHDVRVRPPDPVRGRAVRCHRPGAADLPHGHGRRGPAGV